MKGKLSMNLEWKSSVNPSCRSKKIWTTIALTTASANKIWPRSSIKWTSNTSTLLKLTILTCVKRIVTSTTTTRDSTSTLHNCLDSPKNISNVSMKRESVILSRAWSKISKTREIRSWNKRIAQPSGSRLTGSVWSKEDLPRRVKARKEEREKRRSDRTLF